MRFTNSDHARTWKHFEGDRGATPRTPSRTDERYCLWEEPRGDYLYTQASVNKLVKELADPSCYRRLTRRAPLKAAA